MLMILAAPAFQAPAGVPRLSQVKPAAMVMSEATLAAAPAIKEDGVVPMGNGVNSWYDSGIRLTPEPVPAEAAATVSATPTTPPTVESEPSRTSTIPPETGGVAAWNPLGVTALPAGPLGTIDLKKFCIAEYLKATPTWLDGSLAGDVGFDPLCLAALAKPTLESDQNSRSAAERNACMLAKSPEEQAESVLWMRESELKHGRLAMMAAAGWPLAELCNGSFLQFAGTNGRAPSLFNGGLFDFPFFPFVLLATLGTAFVESASAGQADLGFDPLGCSENKDGLFAGRVRTREELQLSEIKHGRVAMMAITGMAVQEFVWGTPVVDQTPFFFGR